MNFTKSFFTLALTGLIFVGCKNTGENTKETTTTETEKTSTPTDKVVGKLEKVSFTIKGMSCAVMCAAKIEKDLKATEGVKTATVDFDKETAIVEFDNAKLSAENLKEKVEAEVDGKTYTVSNIQTLN
ncbi:MAG: heavy-metal-associated domain-containing protein [Flavobacterium sp.]